MSLPQVNPGDAPITYGDYLKWPDEERWEIIDGVPYDMSPAPSTRHQRILGELFAQIYSFFPEMADCEVFLAPFDVRLPEGDEADEAVTSVVQPDLAIVCDSSKIDDRGCRGAPDWIIEILSPGTAAKDFTTKRSLYEKSGVQEYWLVHPVDHIITTFILGTEGTYKAPVFHEGKGELSVGIFPELKIDLDTVFR